MNLNKHTAPTYRAKAYTCPYCETFSRQMWLNLYWNTELGHEVFGPIMIALCDHCNSITVWYQKKMIVPSAGGIEPANPDLPEEIQDDYREAALIVNQSPRGAAALLRLCIQKLCVQLGEKGKNINNDIAELVKNGLPVQIQRALDIVRVIGNEAVHPGVLDIKDDRETATQLFRLINLIAYERITRPKEIDALYEKLPQCKRDGIDKRDGKPKP